MDFIQLQSLIAIAEERSFTRAAHRVFVSQPAISRQIKLLEDELGVPLVERQKKQTIMTAAGKALVERARHIIAVLEDAKREIDDMSNVLRGHITFACSDTFSTHLLIPALDEFCAEHPEIQVTIYNKTSSQIAHLVLEAAIDFGLVLLPCAYAQLHVQPLFSYDEIAVVSRDHPLAGAATIGLAELTHHRLLVLESGTMTRKLLDEALASRGLKPPPLMEVGSVEVQKSFAGIGLGAAIVPDYAIQKETAAGRLHPLRITDLKQRTIGLVARSDLYLTNASRTFIGNLTSSLPS